MTASPPLPQDYGSPKRKRGATDSIEFSPTVSPRLSRIATALSEDCPFLQHSTERSDRRDDGSPSSKVTCQLRTLGLQGTFTRQIPFIDAGGAKKRFAKSGQEPALRSLADKLHHEVQYGSLLPESVDNVLPAHASLNLDDSFSSSAIVDRPRAHSRSPPLGGNPEDNPMTWHESEITGHNPTDPNDDGYGINGIGFKPTPAVAWARSEKRKQQLADYRNREAREARERRSEKRRGTSVEPSVDNAGNMKRSARVRFGDVR